MWMDWTIGQLIDPGVDNVVIVFHLGRIQIFRRMFYTIDIYNLNTFQHILNIWLWNVNKASADLD